jgi:hypothetical protein
VQAPNADYDGGGWEFKVNMFADADPTNIIEGALCVLFADDYYGNTKQSIGQLENRENIICWGYIAGEEEIDWDAEASAVEFSVHGPHYWLDQIEINPLSLAMATSAPSWGSMPKLGLDRFIWHALHWRSNATALLNITLTGDTRYAPSFDSVEGSLWSQMNEIAWKKIFGRIGCDRYGRFFAVIDPQCVPEGDRSWATVMTLTKKDWKERVGVKRTKDRKLAMLSTSGWVVDTSAAVTTLYSLAMGHINAQYGKGEIIDKLLAVSQEQFNELTGLYMGWKNNELEFDFTLAQNNRMVDLWPNQFLDVSLAAGDTPRGIAYAGKLIPRSITLQPDPDAGCWSTELSCEAETFAEIAINGDIPASAGADEFDMSFPPMPGFPKMPPLGSLVYPSPTEEPNNHPKSVILYSSNFGVMYTTTFDEDNPTWYFMNAGLETLDRTEITNMVITPSGKIYILTNGDNSGWQKVMVADGPGGTWRQVLSATDYDTHYGQNNARLWGLGVNPLEEDQVAVWGGRPWSWPSDGNFGYVRLAIISDGVVVYHGGNNIFRPGRAEVLFTNNGWTVFANQGVGILGSLITSYCTRLSADGTVVSAINSEGSANYGVPSMGCAAGSQDLSYFWKNTGLYKITSDGTVVTGQSITPPDIQGVAFSPTGIFGMGANGSSPVRTSDGGATWGTAAGVIPIGSTVWENCKDDFRWIFGGGTVIRLTMDWGATYVDKMGNLSQLAALISITGIRFIE